MNLATLVLDSEAQHGHICNIRNHRPFMNSYYKMYESF